MGSSQWGHGFHTGHEQGHSEGFSEGKAEGLLIGIVLTVVGTVATAVGGYLIHKHGGWTGIKNKFLRRKTKPHLPDRGDMTDPYIENGEVGDL